MSEKDLQEYLSKEFQGEDSFLENIIFPIFDESNYQTAYRLPVLEGDDSLKALAARCGIQEVILYGTVSIGHIIIQIFEVTVQDHVQMSRNRVTIQQIIRRIMETYSSAFIIFHYEDNWQLDWRFSYCQKDAKDMTEAKRYTFLLGPNQSCRTAAQNFMKLMGKGSSIQREEIEDAFSVEALSKEFFGRYKEIYENIILYVTGKKMVKVGNKWEEQEKGAPCDEIMQEFSSFKDPEKAVRDYVKKLMGRLVFLQFLQKKGWLGVPADEGWGKGKHDFMQDLYERTEDKLNFIDNVLEVLFNDLNTERDNDIASQAVGSNIRIPYLNGGLFERDEADEKRFPLPPEHLDNLFKFFSWYNFTIDENDPDDAEMSVDPEMLGRIFENLLEDNKDKGAFYTPKEIVSYMCRESLISYLQTDIEDETTKVAIREFVTTHRKNDKLPSDINLKLRDVKICDPAIGSGAFPMGLLKELFLCRTSIEDNEHINAAEIKKHIIQNNIYGVDLERGAVDIARLRFWLSLIVDEESPRALPNLDYKIVEGNSLITTFDGQYIDLTTDVGLLRSRWSSNKIKTEKAALKEEQNRFFNLNGEEKYKSVIKIKKHILNCIGYQLEYEKNSWENAVKEQPSLFGGNVKSKKDKRPHVIFTPERQKILDKCYKLVEILSDESKSIQERAGLSVPFFEWKTVFSDIFEDGKSCGFDIVIGNPPYIRPHNLSEETKKLMWSKYDTYVKKADYYVCFIQRAASLSKHNGIITMIVSDSWLRLDSFEKIRNFILSNTSVKRVIDFTKDVFENANVKASIISMIKCEEDNNIISFAITDDAKKLETLEMRQIKQSTYNHTYKKVFDLSIDNETTKLRLKIKKDSSTLEQLFKISFGIKTGDDDKFLTFAPDISPLCRKLVRGADINRWKIDFKGEYVIYDTQGMRTNKRTARPGSKERFEQPKILVRDTGGGLMCTFDNNNYYVKDVLVIEDLEKNIPTLKILAALLNSKAMRWFYESTFPTLHVQRDELASLPIPLNIFSTDYQDTIIPIVDRIIRDKISGLDTTVDEEKLDNIIYTFYGLTDMEIGIIDNSLYV